MGISTFPAPSAGGGETNDFIIDKADTTNTTFSPGRSFAGGGYSVVVTGSTAYDIYLLDADGSAVGYTNGTSIVASSAFETVSALGLGTADVVAFTYNGPSTDATTTGDEPGAGPFLTSITPSDLPQQDDTAVVAGGNFANNVEISFVSGTVTKAAKNVVVGSSTALVVTRPDDLIEDLAPYDLKAINPGVTEPTGSGLNLLSGTVTAGTDPSFVTTSPILGAFTATAFSTAILTSDSEGTVVNWQVTAGTIPPGLSLATATGVISGTPSADGDYYFTVQITDDGDNTNSQEFRLPVGEIIEGGNSTVVGGTAYNYFTSSGDFTILNLPGTVTMEYIVIAGGGGGGQGQVNQVGGGGGAGGLLFGTASLTDADSGIYAMVVGAGGGSNVSGSNSVWPGIATAVGGGRGGYAFNLETENGGSGGGASTVGYVGTGIPGQGFNGGAGGGSNNYSGGGGGAGEAGNTDGIREGGDGLQYSDWATATGLGSGNYFAGGGGGGDNGASGSGGLGGGGNGGTQNQNPTSGVANSGGGGGGGRATQFGPAGGTGGSGAIIVRRI